MFQSRELTEEEVDGRYQVARASVELALLDNHLNRLLAGDNLVLLSQLEQQDKFLNQKLQLLHDDQAATRASRRDPCPPGVERPVGSPEEEPSHGDHTADLGD